MIALGLAFLPKERPNALGWRKAERARARHGLMNYRSL